MSFDLDGWLSLASACCLLQGAHRSHSINTISAERGDLGLRAVPTVDMVHRIKCLGL